LDENENLNIVISIDGNWEYHFSAARGYSFVAWYSSRVRELDTKRSSILE
jgi:hypothetical protein